MLLKNRELIELIKQTYKDNRNSVDFPLEEVLDQKIQLFQEKFGPDALMAVNGKELLLKLHRPKVEGEEQSLAYWLEKKNDEEFPDYFGRSAVGHAGQFRVYFSPQADSWRNKILKNISEAEAIQIAEENRDFLIKADKKCKELLKNKTFENYYNFNRFMREEIPELKNNNWFHKYLYLMNPDKLSDIHSSHYLLHMLLRMCIYPDKCKGKLKEAYYEFDYYYLMLSKELEIPMTYLSATIFQIYGKTNRYYVLQLNTKGKTIGIDSIENYKKYLIENQVFCFGLKELGDIERFSTKKANLRPFIKKVITELENLGLEYNNDEKKEIGQNFGHYYIRCGRKGMRDVITILDNNNVLLIGQLEEKSDFEYKKDEPYPYQRKIRWQIFKDAKITKIPQSIHCFYRTTIHTSPEFIIEIEKLRSTNKIPEPDISKEIKNILNALERKKQVILYGPPGTGKTYCAIKTAEYVVASNLFKRAYNNLTLSEQSKVYEYISKCCFHPSYGYENFIIGYFPETEGNKLVFKPKNGIFKEICEEASKPENKKKDYYIIIDEINRGDIPRIFGELMMIIEKDKRGEEIKIPIQKELFKIPPNIYIIGTMNTADRSIALLDTALRRRFAFIEFMPDYTFFEDVIESEDLQISLKKWLKQLNLKIREELGKDGRNLQIGHAYLLKKEGIPIREIENFVEAFRQDIIPLLEEYCYGDYAMLARIIGEKIVNIKDQVINEQLFKSENYTQLLQIIQEEYPDVIDESIFKGTEEDEIEDDLEEEND